MKKSNPFLQKAFERILESCKTTNFELKSRDFEKLIFDPVETKKVLLFREYIKQK